MQFINEGNALLFPCHLNGKPQQICPCVFKTLFSSRNCREAEYSNNDQTLFQLMMTQWPKAWSCPCMSKTLLRSFQMAFWSPSAAEQGIWYSAPSVCPHVRPSNRCHRNISRTSGSFLLVFAYNVYLGGEASGPPVDFGVLEVIFTIKGHLRRFWLRIPCLHYISRTSRPIFLIFSTSIYMRQGTKSC